MEKDNMYALEEWQTEALWEFWEQIRRELERRFPDTELAVLSIPKSPPETRRAALERLTGFLLAHADDEYVYGRKSAF